MTRTRTRGFTLIEVLVVVSIIALLMAILLPALGAAKKTAKKQVCANHLTSAGHGMVRWLEDWEDEYPIVTTSYELYGGSAVDLPLNKYLDNVVDVAQCPLDTGVVGNAAPSAYVAFGTSYIYFARDQDYISGVWVAAGRRKTEMKFPSYKMLVADLILPVTGGSVARANNPKHYWHNNKEPLQVNMLFADGHVDNPVRKIGGEASITGPPPEKLLESTKAYY